VLREERREQRSGAAEARASRIGFDRGGDYYCPHSTPSLCGQETLDLADDRLWVVDPGVVPCPGNPDEAKIRILCGESRTLLGRSECVPFGPDQERRRRQGSPTLAENHFSSISKSPGTGDAPHQAKHALDVASHVRDVDVEQQIVEFVGILDEDLAPELPAPVARRIREHVPAESLPDDWEA
jgi:hypothetical protein